MKPVYPYKKISEAFYLLRGEFFNNMWNEGWVIDTLHDTLRRNMWKDDETKWYFYQVTYSTSFINDKYLTKEDIYTKAREHGIIVDYMGTIIDFNKEKFNESLYLWTGEKLGLL